MISQKSPPDTLLSTSIGDAKYNSLTIIGEGMNHRQSSNIVNVVRHICVKDKGDSIIGIFRQVIITH